MFHELEVWIVVVCIHVTPYWLGTVRTHNAEQYDAAVFETE